ncbi:MAG: S8 family serine peptidase [Bacteroidetes bacterium]|nr:S8 family serine peptidase [Bacteroidota bacterium]
MNRIYTWLFAAGILLSSVTIAQQNTSIYLQSGTVQPASNLSEFIAETSPSDVYNGYYYRLIQFNSLPGMSEQNAMRQSGLIIMDYVPTNSFIVAIPLSFNKSLISGFNARSIIKLSAAQKISRNIIGGFQDWAINERGTVDLAVQYQGNISHSAALTSALEHGKLLSQEPKARILNIRISDFSLMQLAAQPWVSYVNTIAAPGEKEDTKGKSLHRSNVINSDYATGRHYDGDGVSIAIADDGFVGPHIDFTGRLTNFATGSGQTHGDMTTGIAGGAGNLNPTIRGMASGANLFTYNIGSYPQIVDAVANFNNHGIVIASTSYSQGCNEYTSDTQFGDQLLFDNPQLQFVFSGGNNGGGNCSYGAGAGWGNITGGYKQGKNVVACGNLDALEVLDNTSSRGPASDGRVKPDICANGAGQLSTDENNSYLTGGGTSAASPGIAGIFGQMFQAYKELNSAPNPPAALIKACLLNSAEDIGNPGPDFTYDWGRVNAYRALTTLEENRYLTDSVSQGNSNTHSITVPAGVEEVRVMVYWADVGGTPLSAPSLVNNINMTVTDPSAGIWNPWILDPTPLVASLTAPAIRGVDSLNNMELVSIATPAAGVYDVTINGYALPSIGQRYYLVWEFRTNEVTLTYPNGGEGFVPGESEVIRWDGRKTGGNYLLEYTTDNGVNWNTISAAIPQTLQQFTWNIPNSISGEVKVRVSRNGFSDESDSSFAIIGLPTGITVDWACPDSMQISFNAVAGAVGYTGYLLRNKYMEVAGNSATNTMVLYGVNPTIDNWLSVSAKTAQGNTGRRANAVFHPAGVFNCTITTDANLEVLANPSTGTYQDCQDNSAVVVAVLIKNYGVSALTNVPVNFSLDGTTTITENFVGTINPGASQLFSFATTIDISLAGNYVLDVWLTLPGDQNVYNDSAKGNFTVIGGTIATLPFSNDFESDNLCAVTTNCEGTVCPISNGWINETNSVQDDIDFRVIQGATASTGTGPVGDHTLGTAAGKYVYLEASNCFGKSANLVSPCFDLTTASSPQMTFWYHMWGPGMGELRIDIYSSGGWVENVIPAIIGNQGNQWLQAAVNLTPWSGDIINVRFRGTTGNAFTSDIAIDDINVVESSVPPVPAFIVNAVSGCTGKVFYFTDQSLNAPTGWSWVFTPSTVTFVNGTSASSANPEVVFNATGFYDVELTATNGFGGGTVTQTSFISILPAVNAPLIEDFQSGTFPPVGWNIDDAGGAFTWTEAVGIAGSNGNPTTCSFVENFSYNNAGAQDGLETVEISLANASAAVLTFDVSYARFDSTLVDTLRVDISTDCGTTWIPSGYQKEGTTLATVGDNTNSWVPTLGADWRNDTINLSSWIGSNILVKFVNINGYGNNLYIDNVNVDATVGIEQPDLLGLVSVYPNPSAGLFNLELRGVDAKQVSYTLTDLQGRVVTSQRVNAGTNYSGIIDLRQAPQGVYLLRLVSEKGNRTVKMVKL